MVDVTGGIEIDVRSIIHRCLRLLGLATQERARRVTGELQDLSVPELKKKAKVPIEPTIPRSTQLLGDGCFHLPNFRLSFDHNRFLLVRTLRGVTGTGFVLSHVFHHWTSTMKESKIHIDLSPGELRKKPHTFTFI